MKGQLIPFAFLILVVFGIIGGYVFFNIFYGKKYESELLDIRIFNEVRNVIEAFKAHLRLSNTYSSQQALRESACFGGLISEQPWAWICGGSNPLSVEKSKECSEKFIKYYLNVYASNFSISLPLNSIIKNFTSCEMNVDESGVFSGKYDEGNFWVNCTGSSIILKSKELTIMEDINISELITHNRFWYIFRIVTNWTNENYYGNCICAATMGCGDCNDVENCAEEALRRLQQKFDEYVECRREKSAKCCEQETGPLCGEPQQCLPWDACPTMCNLECGKPPLSTSVCIPKKGTVIAKGLEDTIGGESNILSFSPYISCYSRVWNEWKLAGKDLYVCEDHKYYIPSPKGPIPLQFKIVAQASFRVPHPTCESIVECDCPDDATSCSECIQTGCTECREG